MEDLIQRKYSICIGISIGNKWFNSKNIIDLIKWSLQFSKEQVIVYVADSIHAINLKVRNRISYERAYRIATKRGEKILAELKDAARPILGEHDFRRVLYAKWDDLVDRDYAAKTDYLHRMYAENQFFATCIHNITREVTSSESRRFSDQDIHELGNYIIEELPELLCRVAIKGIRIDAYAYPFDGPLPIFVEQIQRGLLFPGIKAKLLDTQPKVFLEVR